MKVLLILLISSFLSTGSDQWQNNYDVAIAKATEENKPILLSFAGSDWCKPCIMLTREVFEDQKFKDYAAENLVLLQLDFPRLKKNLLSEEQTKHNEKLAAKYNKTGEFPLVVLINTKGEVIAKTGYQKGGADNFISYLKSVL
jgi:thioredoxin-related protein